MNYQEEMAGKMQSIQSQLDFYKNDTAKEKKQFQHKFDVAVSGNDSLKGQLEISEMKIQSLMSQLEHSNSSKL